MTSLRDAQVLRPGIAIAELAQAQTHPYLEHTNAAVVKLPAR